jgi:hypothetical protein
MKKPPAFQWYPRDCDTDENVRMMDDSEFGFYVRCLNHSWVNDGLPVSLEDVARIIGRPLARVEKYWVRVGNCFVVIDNRLRNLKQEAQRTEYEAFQKKRRNAAIIRWDKPIVDSKSNAHALHVESSASSPAPASATEVLKPPAPKPGAVKRKTQIPFETLPEEWRDYAVVKLGWTFERAESTFETMRLWATSKGATYLNWESAWQGWCRRENDKSAPSINVTAKRNGNHMTQVEIDEYNALQERLHANTQ